MDVGRRRKSTDFRRPSFPNTGGPGVSTQTLIPGVALPRNHRSIAPVALGCLSFRRQGFGVTTSLCPCGGHCNSVIVLAPPVDLSTEVESASDDSTTANILAGCKLSTVWTAGSSLFIAFGRKRVLRRQGHRAASHIVQQWNLVLCAGPAPHLSLPSNSRACGPSGRLTVLATVSLFRCSRPISPSIYGRIFRPVTAKPRRTKRNDLEYWRNSKPCIAGSDMSSHGRHSYSSAAPAGQRLARRQ